MSNTQNPMVSHVYPTPAWPLVYHVDHVPFSIKFMVSPTVSVLLLQDVAQLAAELAGKPFTGEERITFDKLSSQVARCAGANM